MGRRDEDLDEDEEIEELEDNEDDEDEPAPRKKAPRAKAAPAKAAKRSTPEEARALDARIFEAADLLAEKLGRAPTHGEIAAAARVQGTSDDARRVRVAKALRRRGLLTAPAPAKTKPAKPVIIARPPVAPTLIEALVAERARLAGIVARLDATIADLGGAS